MLLVNSNQAKQHKQVVKLVDLYPLQTKGEELIKINERHIVKVFYKVVYLLIEKPENVNFIKVNNEISINVILINKHMQVNRVIMIQSNFIVIDMVLVI